MKRLHLSHFLSMVIGCYGGSFFVEYFRPLPSEINAFIGGSFGLIFIVIFFFIWNLFTKEK